MVPYFNAQMDDMLRGLYDSAMTMKAAIEPQRPGSDELTLANFSSRRCHLRSADYLYIFGGSLCQFTIIHHHTLAGVYQPLV